ncbi:hypothetical protein M422DRAFT_245999 [Sphaerobolus stellatus SS14]|nr:hypothetical protein M422DRAFT_245999 [Sphaerobolus stellatus SS14]
MRFTSAFISTAVCATLFAGAEARPYPAEGLALRQTPMTAVSPAENHAIRS